MTDLNEIEANALLGETDDDEQKAEEGEQQKLAKSKSSTLVEEQCPQNVSTFNGFNSFGSSKLFQIV